MTEEVFLYPQEENDADNHNDTIAQRKQLPWYQRLPRIRFSHVLFYSLLYILIIWDTVAVAHCALSVATDGPSVSILFGFEFAILLVTALSSLSMYHMHVVDGVMGFLTHVAEGEHHYHAVGTLAEPSAAEVQRGEDGVMESSQEDAGENVNDNEDTTTTTTTSAETNPRSKAMAKRLVERLATPWKNRRATLSFAIELQAQAAKFLFYVVFFAIVFTYYGMPINIFREVYVSFQQLRRRLIAFNNYRRLTYNMEQRFESIENEEELNRLGHTCIICRDQMDLSGGCKKLPICGHAFHTHCLREWLVQQQSCPTCRADIAANEARRKRQVEREAAEVAAAELEQVDEVEAEIAQATVVAEDTNETGISDESKQADCMPKSSLQPNSEDQLTELKDKSSPARLPPESEILAPGWIEEWDPVSNKTYYWNKETNETSWSKPTSTAPNDVRSQFNTLLRQHNTQRDAQILERDTLQQQQDMVAARTASHTNNTPCLYRVKNPLGARVFARHVASPKRIIPRGKIIVCTSVHYWPEMRASMFLMPDGFVNSEDVEKFLVLDLPSVDLNASEKGAGIHVGGN